MHTFYQTNPDKPQRIFREKAMTYGIHSLTDAELLAMLLNIPIDTAKEIYGRLLPENKKAILGMSVEELSQLQGMGLATATRLKGILDFGKRIAQSEFPVNLKIKSSHCAYKLILPYLMGQETEYFYVIMIARNNRVIKVELISHGGTAGTVVDPKVVFKRALIHRAHNMILVHNHPSGELEPSAPDKTLTKRLSDAGRHLDIIVMDHLIVSDRGYFSFADEGIL